MDINAISKKIKKYAEERDYVTDREIFSLAKECILILIVLLKIFLFRC